MKKLDGAILAATLASTSIPALAESFYVDLGYGNITPCSTVEWTNDGLFGMPSPTYRTSPQIVHAYASGEAVSGPQLQNDVQQCAVQGAAVAGLGAILASPVGALPAFEATFGTCMSGRSESYFSINLGLTPGQCQ